MVNPDRVQAATATSIPSMEEQADLLRSYRNGFQAVHVITTGLQLGLFEHLVPYAQGLSAQELARITGYHAPYVSTWCTTAYGYYLLETDEAGRFRLAPHMDALLGDPASPDSMSTALTGAVLRQGPQMARFDTYMKTGEQGSHAEAYGQNPERHEPPPNQVALHRKMWLEHMIPKAPGLQQALEQGGRLLDIGCGPGTLLLQLAALYPRARFVGVDIVEVGGLDTARRLLAERGLHERIAVEVMPAEDLAFRDEFDGVVMTSVFHELLPLQLRQTVLQACYQALKRPGVLLNRDFNYPGTIKEFRDPNFTSGAFVQYFEMAWGTTQSTWQERQSMLAKVGFNPVERHFVRGMPQGINYLDVALKA